MERVFSGMPGPGGKQAVADVIVQGPPLQIVVQQGTASTPGALSIGLTGTIGAGGTLTSSAFPTYGCRQINVGLTLSQAGTLVLSRYLDAAGTISLGANVTLALVGATPGVLLVSDGLAAQAAKISIINGGGVAATVSGFAGLMQAQ